MIYLSANTLSAHHKAEWMLIERSDSDGKLWERRGSGRDFKGFHWWNGSWANFDPCVCVSSDLGLWPPKSIQPLNFMNSIVWLKFGQYLSKQRPEVKSRQSNWSFSRVSGWIYRIYPGISPVGQHTNSDWSREWAYCSIMEEHLLAFVLNYHEWIWVVLLPGMDLLPDNTVSYLDVTTNLIQPRP